ncbi:MAG: DUF6709 family protein [Acidobacteriota bacterium]
METWVTAECRKRYARIVGLWRLIALAALIFAAANYRYIVNFTNGPYPMSEQDLISATKGSSPARYFVRVKGTHLIDTGVQEITVTKDHGVEQSRKVTGRFYGLRMGRHALIVKTASPATTLVGTLVPIPKDLRHQLGLEKADSRVYPLFLDTGPFREPGYWAIGAYVLLLAAAVYFAVPAWRKRRDPSADPTIKRVASWGHPIALSQEIEKQYAGSVLFRTNSVVLTKDYIIQETFFAFSIVRFDDLLWAYKRVVKKSVNLIPVGKDHEAVLVCYGGVVAVKTSESEVLKIIGFAAQRAPWAALGYTKELEKDYSKQRSAFCWAIEARKKQMLADPATGRSQAGRDDAPRKRGFAQT